MIHIDRKNIPTPSVFESEKLRKETERLEDFHNDKSNSQKRYKYDSKLITMTRRELLELFRNKCAYCECRIDSHDSFVKHFRPKSQFGEMAYAWENLHITCAACSRSKGTIYEENNGQPMQLDPCLDYPQEHLDFRQDGTVEGITTRGEYTIELLNLNRRSLVEQRNDHFGKANLSLTNFHSAIQSGLGEFGALPPVSTSELFCGQLRQIFLKNLAPEILGKFNNYKINPTFNGLFQEFDINKESDLLRYRAIPTIRRHVDILDTAKNTSDALSKSHENDTHSTLASKSSADSERITSQKFLKSITLKNFKGIDELEIDFSSKNEDSEGWTVLLGENGAGKSSVLQAIALALLPDRESQALYKDNKTFLKKRKRKGLVTLKLELENKTFGFTLSPKGLDFSLGPTFNNMLIRGYGSTRIEGKPEAQKSNILHQSSCSLKNIFDPFATLINAELWLCKLKKNKWNQVAKTLKDLISIEENNEPQLHRKNNEVLIKYPDGTSILYNDLSDGYRSIITLAVDIMSATTTRVEDMQNVSGVVLIDELGTHLHPRWRMQVVSMLRKAFPKIQFIVSTHEPLCLRGLKNDEVILMTKKDGQVKPRKEGLPDPSNLRVEQLLTSEHFGLESTIDPEVDRLFHRYYELIALRNGAINLPEDFDLEEFSSIQDKLRKRGVLQGLLGYSRRDRLLYKVIDEVLATEGAAHKCDNELAGKIRAKLKTVWNNVLPFD